MMKMFWGLLFSNQVLLSKLRVCALIYLFFQSSDQCVPLYRPRSCTHPHTDRTDSSDLPAHQDLICCTFTLSLQQQWHSLWEQSEVQCLAQGRSDTWTGSANLLTSGWPTLPPELQPPSALKLLFFLFTAETQNIPKLEKWNQTEGLIVQFRGKLSDYKISLSPSLTVSLLSSGYRLLSWVSGPQLWVMFVKDAPVALQTAEVSPRIRALAWPAGRQVLLPSGLFTVKDWGCEPDAVVVSGVLHLAYGVWVFILSLTLIHPQIIRMYADSRR